MLKRLVFSALTAMAVGMGGASTPPQPPADLLSKPPPRSTFLVAQVKKCSIADCGIACESIEACVAKGGSQINCGAKLNACLNACAMNCSDP